MAEHTPGPWRNNGGQIEAGDYRTVVAIVGIVNEQSQRDTANARLIAAAPALLEALEALTLSPLSPARVVASHLDVPTAWVESAQEAIAQTRGEATHA